MSPNTNFENDPPSSGIGGVIENKGKSLLTQEFNTILPVNSLTSSTTMTKSNTLNSSSNSPFNLYSADPSSIIPPPSSLPFLISPDDTSLPHVPAPAFIYHPFPFNPPQMFSPEQYYMMMLAHQNNVHNIHSVHSAHSVIGNVRVPVQPASKRIKLNTGSSLNSNSLADQLNGFKNSLKSSFNRNLQKLEVLDRLVQTVQLKGSLQFESLKGALDLLKVTRLLLKELASEQVDMTATLTSEIRSVMLPDILKLLRSSLTQSQAVNCSKVELVDKLRKEEDLHLADLTILSARNKELQKDQRALKDQLDRLQLEYSDSLKLAARRKEDYDRFTMEIRALLGIEIDSSQLSTQIHLIEGIEAVLVEKQLLISREKEMKEYLGAILTDFEAIKRECKDLDGPNDCKPIEDCFNSTLSLLYDRFDEIFQTRERYYNDTLNLLIRKFDELLKLQNELTHKSLSLRVGLQGQLADSHEAIARLRRHCQELTVELNSNLTEVGRKRLALQVKESEANEFKRKFETSQERLQLLEQELSIKNQENRAYAIRIQGLEVELEETRIQNRHDISSLERKISILESKLGNVKDGSSENGNNKLICNLKLEGFVDLDPFSSVEADRGDKKTDSNNHAQPGNHGNANDHSDCHIANVSVIPPTVAPLIKKTYMVTFTGIRDSQKQKELTAWLHELGGIVHVGADFNDDITHVLAPRGYKSIRVLAASLTGKWIVPIEWVEACHRAGHFVPEALANGFNNTSIRPFRFRTLWMSAAFSATHKSHPVYPVAALRTLLEKLGKARWSETQTQADFLLVTEEEKESKLITSSRGALVTLNNLINMIPIE